MQINSIKNLKLPSKKDEEFLKIDFETFFSKNFENIKINEFELENLSSGEDKNSYNSILFDIAKSFSSDQKVLKITKSTQKPIIIDHTNKELDSLNISSLKIEVESGVKASVIEIFSLENSVNFVANRELVLKENSSLEYAKIDNLNKDSSMIFSTNAKCEDDSNLDIYNFNIGLGFCLNNYENSLDAQNINYSLNGLNKLKNSSNSSTLVKTIHNNKNSTSSINYKNSLKDNSRAVVKITSIVNEKAPYSKAFQNCNSILLSDDAVVFAQPHLEIYIDELEASHGTTTGTLNKDQLYYLQSRGISKDEAYDMLLVAFESSIKDSIKDEELKNLVEEYLK